METTKISAGTIARTIILALALVNHVLTFKGYSILPIEDDTITEAVTIIWTITASVVAWWKNNSFTKAAIVRDQTKNEVKGV